MVGNSDPAFLAARQAALEAYVERLARHPKLGTSLDLFVFLDANEAGLEAAKTYIEEAAAEGVDSLLERGMDTLSSLVRGGAGGGSGGAPPLDVRADPAYVAMAGAHSAVGARLGGACAAGGAAASAGGATCAALTDFAKAAIALGELERRCGGVIAGARASVAAARRAAEAHASLLGGLPSAEQAAAAAAAVRAAAAGAAGAAGGGEAALVAAARASAPPAADSAAAAAFNAHSKHLAAGGDSSISGMFETDFNDPYSALAAANVSREALASAGGGSGGGSGGALGAAPPGSAAAASLLATAGGSVRTTADLLLICGNALLECSALARRHGEGAPAAFLHALRLEQTRTSDVSEAVARREDACGRAVEANAHLQRKRNAALALKAGDKDYAARARECQAAVDKAEAALKARKEELGKITEVLKVRVWGRSAGAA